MSESIKQVISIAGFGRLGKAIAEELLRRGHSVKGGRRSISDEVTPSNAEMFALDFLQIDEDVSVFFRADWMIISLPPSSGIFAFQNIVTQSGRAGAQGILLISSTSVYGKESGTYTELSPADGGPRARAQKEIEQLVTEQFPDALILRCGGLIGPGRHPGRFFASGEASGSSTETVNLVDERDVARAAIRLIEQNQTGIFNCVYPSQPQRGEYYGSAAADAGRAAPGFETNDPIAPRIISSEKLREQAGFEFQFPIQNFGK